MACSKPLLIISGQNTPLNNFLYNTNAAFMINSTTSNEKIEQALEVIHLALENPQILTTMGANGLEIIKKNYSKEVVTQKYLNLVSSLL